MERIRRVTSRAAIGLATLAGAVALAAADAEAQTRPGPVLEKVELRSPAIVGREVELQVEAVDPAAPVNGMVVQFGRRHEVFGLSACRPPDSTALLPEPPFAPGSKVRLTGLHKYRRKGARRALVRVDSGGCLLPLMSIFQAITVTPTDPGRRPVPIDLKLPGLVPPPGGNGLPQLSPQASGLAAARGRACPGGGRGPGRSAGGLRRARKAVLCLLNRQRRARRLPGLRANARLRAAAEAHSRSMVVNGYFSHFAPGGLSMVDRVLRSGYLSGAGIWAVGENLGFGRGPVSTPRAMVRSWMRSTPHRANILAGKFREVGLGIVPGTPGRPRASGNTYTTDFGVSR